MLPHIWNNGEIGLEDLQGCIQLLEAAFVDNNHVATGEGIMWEITQTSGSEKKMSCRNRNSSISRQQR